MLTHWQCRVCVFLLSIKFGTVYENFYTNAAHLLTCGVSELNMNDSTRSYPQVKREDLNKYFKGGGGGGVGATMVGKGGGRHTLILRASDTSHCLHRYNSTLITVWFIDSPKVEKTGLQLGRGIPLILTKVISSKNLLRQVPIAKELLHCTKLFTLNFQLKMDTVWLINANSWLKTIHC